MPEKTKLTTTAGNPIANNQDSLTAGRQGPVLLQDYQLLEKLAHQNRERIPERVVHAKGWGAHGDLTITHDITKYTKAKLFKHVGETIPLFLRFSTVAGELGAADAERDVRGFALKLYTEEAIGILLEITHPFFLFVTPINFLILFIHKSVIPKPICVIQMRCGIFGHCLQKVYIK